MRVLIYSHDTYGLGHLRRSLGIARVLTSACESAEVLIVTGSPRAGSFTLPPRCRIQQLPAVRKKPDGSYESRDGRSGLAEVLLRRGAQVCRSFERFRPDCILVDHAPLGAGNELVPLLERLRRLRRRPVLILGMRDIVDDVEVTRASWTSSGAMDALRNDYDRILVYGPRTLPTTAMELGLDEWNDACGQPKVRHLGYLLPELESPIPGNEVWVTAGGGGDGHRLLRAVATFLEEEEREERFEIVSGPFLSKRRFAELESRLRKARTRARLRRFEPGLDVHFTRARAVIAMAGYNTVVELAASGRPALLVPRETPRVEQLLRAQRASRVFGFQWCRAKELDTRRIREFLDAKPGRSSAPPEHVRGVEGLIREFRLLASGLTAAGVSDQEGKRA